MVFCDALANSVGRHFNWISLRYAEPSIPWIDMKSFSCNSCEQSLYFFFCKIWINICIPYYTPITQSLLTALMASDSVLCGISHVRTDIHTAGCHSATLSGLSAVCCCVYSAPIYCPAPPARLFAKLLNTCPSVGKSIVYIHLHTCVGIPCKTPILQARAWSRSSFSSCHKLWYIHALTTRSHTDLTSAVG